MGKGIASKLARVVREGVKKGCAGLAKGSLGSRSYPVFGVPCGLTGGEISPKEIYPSTEMELQPPKTIDPTFFWRYRDALEKKGSSQSAGLFALSKATATALGGNLTKKGKLVTTYLHPVDGKPHHRHDLFRFSTKRFFPRIYRSEKPVITLAAGWQDAFYHWMYEVLPRIHLAEKGGHSLDTVFAATGAGFQKESLELMGLSSEAIVDANTYDAISAPHIIVPSTPIMPTKWGCAFLRERLIPKLKCLPRKRYYVSRRDATRRRIENEEEVYGLLKEHGFERIELSNLPFKEQMELFHSAEMIVGPHGAGFSHLVFCEPGTPFLEFFHPGYVNICYWYLANLMDHPYYYLFGEGERYPDNFDPHIDPDITVDLKKLDATLKLMLHDLNR